MEKSLRDRLIASIGIESSPKTKQCVAQINAGMIASGRRPAKARKRNG